MLPLRSWRKLLVMQVVVMSVCEATLWPFPQITSNSHIGCFEYMKEKFAHSPTRDMSEEMLVLFSNLMRVNVPRSICLHLFLVFNYFSPTRHCPSLSFRQKHRSYCGRSNSFLD